VFLSFAETSEDFCANDYIPSLLRKIGNLNMFLFDEHLHDIAH